MLLVSLISLFSRLNSSLFSSSHLYFLHPLYVGLSHPSSVRSAMISALPVLMCFWSGLINYLPPDIWHRPPPVFLLCSCSSHHLHFISYLRLSCQISSSYNLIWRPYHWQDRCFFTKLSILGILIAPKSFDATLDVELQSLEASEFQVPFQVVMTCYRSSPFNNFNPTLYLSTFSQEASSVSSFLFSIP